MGIAKALLSVQTACESADGSREEPQKCPTDATHILIAVAICEGKHCQDGEKSGQRELRDSWADLPAGTLVGKLR